MALPKLRKRDSNLVKMEYEKISVKITRAGTSDP